MAEKFHHVVMKFLHIILTAWLLGPGWVNVEPAAASDFDEVEIRGNLPRNDDRTIDITGIRETVIDQFAQGTREVQFRDFLLTPEETHDLFLAPDPNQNLLRQIGVALPRDGIEREVKLRGIVDGQRTEGRIQRQKNGTLRIRVRDLLFKNLSTDDRARLAQELSAQTGFDRVRLEGMDGQGNRVRTEFRSDKGLVKNEAENHERRGGADLLGTNVRRGNRHDDRNIHRRETPKADRRHDRREDRQVTRHEDRREDHRKDRQLDRRADRHEDRQLERRQARQENRRFDRRLDRHIDRPTERRAARVERSNRGQRPERINHQQRLDRSSRGGSGRR